MVICFARLACLRQFIGGGLLFVVAHVVPRGYILSGALTPSRPRPLRSTWPVASFSQRRVRCTSSIRRLAERDDAAGVVPAVVGAGEFLEVAGDPVRLAQFGGLQHDARELGEHAEQDALGLVRQRRGVEHRAVDPAASALRATARVRACAYCT